MKCKLCGNSKDSDDGPIQQCVLADIYAWLEAHSGLSHSVATTAASTMGANTSSLNTNTTSPSKR